MKFSVVPAALVFHASEESVMYSLIRPYFLSLDPEIAHDRALRCLSHVPRCCFPAPRDQSRTWMGIDFAHPIGLAAGFDKNGEHLEALEKLGFSFIEIGTVTPRPQAGQTKPRLFRLPAAGALINRMGFNNHGVDTMVENLKKTRYRGVLGINIGKNKDTALDHAADDYLLCLRRLYAYADYFTINISSPNTPDLRQLQQGAFFDDLIKRLCQTRAFLAEQHQRYVPMLVKVSPDESDEVLKKMSDVALQRGLDGMIASNTTCARDEVKGEEHAKEAGGLSGTPLFHRSTHALRVLKACVGEALTLIGVGGISTQTQAQEKINAGANLLQLYTGLIYQGPTLVRQASKCLLPRQD